MQLDIFEHSRDVMLRNGVVDALHARDVLASTAAIGALAAQFGDDLLLRAFNTLCERLELTVAQPLDVASAEAILHITENCVPPAQEVFGGGADAWLAPFWIELAAAIAHLPFDPRNETLHAAALLLRAGSWAEAGAHIDAIAAWRRQPAPLAWKVEVECRIAGLGAAWPFLAELSWMAPQRAAALAPRLSNPELSELLRHFDAEYEGADGAGDFAWFPAWVLIADHRWAAGMRFAQSGTDTPAERCARLLLNLLSLERQGRHTEMVGARKKLRDTHAWLFDRYMQSR